MAALIHKLSMQLSRVASPNSFLLCRSKRLCDDRQSGGVPQPDPYMGFDQGSAPGPLPYAEPSFMPPLPPDVRFPLTESLSAASHRLPGSLTL